jgi:hypothetical protein
VDPIATYGLESSVTLCETFPSKDDLERIHPNTIVILEHTNLHNNLEHIQKLIACAHIAQVIYCTEKLDEHCFKSFADARNSIAVVASGWRRTLKEALYPFRYSVECSPSYADVKIAKASTKKYAAFPMLFLKATCVMKDQTLQQIMYTNMRWTLGLQQRRKNDFSIPFY